MNKKESSNYINYLMHERTPKGVKKEIINYIGKKKPFLRDLLSLFLYPKKRYEEKTFVLNSGGCASTYLAELLKENGISEVYHKKPPSMDYSGVKEYLGEGNSFAYLLLGLSRINVNVEISHDIFPFSRHIKRMYPEAKFIHLHRSGTGSIKSVVDKVLYPEIFEKSTRIKYA